MKYHHNIRFKKDVPLSQYTTIGLGGRAKYFVSCKTIEQVRECLIFAKEANLPVQILGGGSNTIFADEGFNGLVLRIELCGIALHEGKDRVLITAGAGEVWDKFVKYCVEKKLAGIECLSGIPGSVGATPIQNIGAYGQEVSNTIVSLNALDRKTLEPVEFKAEECDFNYRQSRFKSNDKNRYIILKVIYQLRKNGKPEFQYPELADYIKRTSNLYQSENGTPTLNTVRDAVLKLRKRKSMLVDPSDPNSRSIGSFFLNPTLSKEDFKRLVERFGISGGNTTIPSYYLHDGVKVPAGWLVEQCGFQRGYRRGGVGISSNHALAIINCGGTTTEVLDLAHDIQDTVFSKFGIHLEIEPEIVI